MLFRVITFFVVWHFALAASQTTDTFRVRGSIVTNQLLTDVSQLPTDTSVVLNGGETFGYMQPSGQFYINNVEVGQHLLEFESTNYVFPKLILKIERTEGKAVLSAWYHQPGFEANTADRSLPFPLKIAPTEKRQFIVARDGFSIMKILKNPYMLMVGMSLIFMVIIPKFQDMMTEEEIEMSSKMLSTSQPRAPDFSSTLAQMTSSKKPVSHGAKK